jgi:hypothetical protein
MASEADGQTEIDLARLHHGGKGHADDHAEEQPEGDQRCNDEADTTTPRLQPRR